MSPRLPERIDPLRLAESGRVLEGQLAIAGMGRLRPVLHSADGSVAVRLVFGVDDSGVPSLRGWGSVRLELICQRCMQPMSLPVTLEFVLGLVTSSGQAECLPGHYEPLIVESRSVLLADIIEDELILALPIVVMHPLEECPAANLADTAEAPETTAAPEANPFAVLAQLKLSKEKQE